MSGEIYIELEVYTYSLKYWEERTADWANVEGKVLGNQRKKKPLKVAKPSRNLETSYSILGSF